MRGGDSLHVVLCVLARQAGERRALLQVRLQVAGSARERRRMRELRRKERVERARKSEQWSLDETEKTCFNFNRPRANVYRAGYRTCFIMYWRCSVYLAVMLRAARCTQPDEVIQDPAMK